MKKLLTLILIFFGYQAYAQVSVLNADSVRMGNPAGSGSVSISGKTYLKNITEGNSNDSVLVRGVAGIVKFVKRSAFADAGIPFFSGDGGATTNGKLIYNTTLQKLRIYDAASSSWKDASAVDLSGYYTKVQSDIRYLNTANNGIIKTGNNFSLGGDVAWDYSGSVRIGGSLQGQLYLDPNAWLLQLADVNNNSANILAQKLGSGGNMNIDLRAYNGPLGLSRAIVIDNTNATQGLGVVDDIGHSGFLYGGKYRMNLSNRSIVDKEYVDSVANVSGSTIHTSNGLTKVGDTIKLGGKLKMGQTLIGNNIDENEPAITFSRDSIGKNTSLVFGMNGDHGRGSFLSLAGIPNYSNLGLAAYNFNDGPGEVRGIYMSSSSLEKPSLYDFYGKGFYYNAAYNENWTSADSLVLANKAYVDKIANGLSDSYVTLYSPQTIGSDKSFSSTISYPGVSNHDYDPGYDRVLVTSSNIESFGGRIQSSTILSLPFIQANPGTPQVANLDLNGSIKTGAFYAGNTSLGFLGAPIGGASAPNIAIGDHDTGINWYGDGDIALRGNGNDFIRFKPGNLLYLPKTPNTATTGYHTLVRDDTTGELMQIAGSGGVVGGAPDTTAYRTVANSFTKAQTNTQIANALNAFIPASQVQNNLSPASTILAPSITAVNTGLALKQDLLVSATNIKTVNGNSILGNGNLVVSGNQTLDQVLTAGNTSTQTANVGTITASAKILGKTTSGTGDLQIGADASNGNFRVIQNGGSSMFGTYDSVNSKYYGFRNDLSSPIANFTGFGGWYQGVASVAGVTSSATDPIFGVVTTNQTGNTPGKGGTNFHVSADKHVETFNNILDNGSGVMQVASLTASQAVFTDGSKNLVSVAVTGTGNAVRAASPTLTGTPLAPTAAAGTNTTQIATTEFVQAALTKVAINTQTANYTLTLADAGKFVQQNVSSANSVTVPPNSTVAFPIGTQILLRQMGTGQVTIAAGSGVTLQSADNALKSRVQFAPITLIKVATNTWAVMGDLTL